MVARRTFLQTAALGAAGAALGIPTAARAMLAPPRPLASGEEGFVRLGVASYSLRSFPRDQAIAMTKALGTRYINLKSVHLDYKLSPAELAAARAEVEAAGLRIVGGGTITFGKDTD